MRGLHREGVERRRVPRACQILFGNLRGIVAREAGVTKLGPFAARRAEHPVEGQIPEGVYAQMVTYLLDVVARRNQFLLTGRIDPVITGTGDGGRRHAEL